MSSERRILLVLFALALGLRVLYAAILATQPDATPGVVTSELGYAREIATGTTWITEPYSPSAPGYPVVLAFFYLLSANQLWLIMFFQAVLGALTILLIFRIGVPFLGTTLSIIAALWVALSVHHMHLSCVFSRDILSVFLLVLLLFLLIRPFENMWSGLIAGLVYAILFHVDPQYVLLIPVFAVLILFKSRHRLLNIQYLFLFLSAFVVASVPWTVRNYAIYGQPIPVGLEARRFLNPAKLVVTEPEKGLADLESKITHASRAHIFQENTVEFWRFARFHGAPAPHESELADTTGGRGLEPAWSLRHNILSILNYGVLLPFFLLGIIFAIRSRNRTGLMLAAVTAAYFLMRSYLGGSEWTRAPVAPLIVLLAFYGILVLTRRSTANDTLTQNTD